MNYPEKQVSGTSAAIILLSVCIADLTLQFIIGMFVGVLQIITGGNFLENTYFQLISSVLLQAVMLAVIMVFFGAIKREKPVLLAPIKKPQLSLLLCIVITVLSLIGFILPAQLFMELLALAGFSPVTDIALNSAGEWVIAVIAMVIVAPIVEEILFRGILLSGLHSTVNTYVAALLCALAFALFHMNPEQTVYQFCLGFVLSLVAIKGGSLLPCIFIHMLNNALSLVAGEPLVYFVEFFMSAPWLAALSAIVFAAACGAAIYFLCAAMEKMNKRGAAMVEPLSAEQTEEEIKSIPAEPCVAEQVDTAEIQTETATIQPPPVQTPPAPATRKKMSPKKLTFILYGVAVGICCVVWLFVFFTSK